MPDKENKDETVPTTTTKAGSDGLASIEELRAAAGI
jgi:hypothetical protein